jgi:uncharacterized protein (TIGR01244 family)
MTTTAGNQNDASNARNRRISRTLRNLVITTVVLAGLHLLVAVPHFAVRLLRGSPIEAFPGIESFARTADSLWRGSAPDPEGYEALAAAGVVTVIDLRAEAEASNAADLAAAAGLDWIHIPIRDGQPPTARQVGAVGAAVAAAPGKVFVHCQAGVGRTGSVIAAVNVAEGASPAAELLEALRFGPLSLEQQVFILRSGRSRPATIPVAAASRIIDSPRRIWSRISR